MRVIIRRNGAEFLNPQRRIQSRLADHVTIDPPEAGLRRKGFVKTEDIRSFAVERLTRRLGQVTQATMAQVEDRLPILLDL